MIKVVKDGVVMVARDVNHLAAFLNNGWKKLEPVEHPEVNAEKPEEHCADGDDAEPEVNDEKPRRGRKPAQKAE